MRILIADDHPVVRLGLKQLLGSHSDLNVVGEAKNCNETLDLAHRLDWDVAVIDYSMPDRNGLELLKDLKRAYPKRPILVLSMYPEELHATRVLKAGASGYINKESASEDLANAIRKAMNGGKYVSATLAERLADQIGADGDRPLHDALSDREYRVMWLLASGRQIKRIAREMTLSASTVSTYRTRILKKLHLVSNAELVQYAIRHKLIDA